MFVDGESTVIYRDMNHTKSFDPSLLYPPFLKKILLLTDACESRGVIYWATSGYRSWQEQDRLYALGRTTKNTDATPQKPLGGKVTNARGGQSFHNMGTAADFALDRDTLRDGLQPDWNLESYRILAEEAQKLGLEAGFFWKKMPDGPHCQLPIGKYGLSLASFQKWHSEGGIARIWSELDAYDW